MFLGTHAPRLDEKGRLILPAKYREELAGGVVITKGQERCLYVFPQEEFTRITEALRPARLRRAAAGLRGDRREHPAGDLGHASVGNLPRRAGGLVRRSRRGGAPG